MGGVNDDIPDAAPVRAPYGAERIEPEEQDAARGSDRALRKQIAELRPRKSEEERAARAARKAGGTDAAASSESRRERKMRRLGIAPTPPTPKSERRAPLPIAPIHEGADFVVSRMGDPAAPRVVLCFAGVGAGGTGKKRAALALGGLQPAEFVGTSQLENSSVLHIADIGRTWFNGFEPDRLLVVLHPFIEGRRLVTLGNSMGGFGAVWITKYLPVELALAFVPQFSVHPEIVPRERRWKEYTSRITEWRARSVADCFVPQTRYFTFNGDRDFHQWRHFRPAPNVDHFVLVGAGHQAAEKIKGAGALGDVIHTCVNGGDPFPVMKAAGLDVHKLGA